MQGMQGIQGIENSFFHVAFLFKILGMVVSKLQYRRCDWHANFVVIITLRKTKNENEVKHQNEGSTATTLAATTLSCIVSFGGLDEPILIKIFFLWAFSAKEAPLTKKKLQLDLESHIKTFPVISSFN